MGRQVISFEAKKKKNAQTACKNKKNKTIQPHPVRHATQSTRLVRVMEGHAGNRMGMGHGAKAKVGMAQGRARRGGREGGTRTA